VRLSVLSDVVPDASFDAAAGYIAAAGAEGIEPLAGPRSHLSSGSDAAVGSLGETVERHGLTVCGLAAVYGPPLGDERIAWVPQAAAALGGRFVRVFAPPFDPASGLDPQLESVAADLRQVCASAPSGIDVLVEISPATLAASPELARRLVERAGHPAAGVVYDPGNMVAEGLLPPSFALALLDGLVRHVHAKNTAWLRREGVWGRRYVPIAAGIVDWTETVDALRRHGYDGWVSIDHLSGTPGPARLRSDVRNLRRLLS
jgi:sugar phosphate isomerase/epimerase